jgi:hypothetical protein
LGHEQIVIAGLNRESTHIVIAGLDRKSATSSLPGLTRQSIPLRKLIYEGDGCAGQARA